MTRRCSPGLLVWCTARASDALPTPASPSSTSQRVLRHAARAWLHTRCHWADAPTSPGILTRTAAPSPAVSSCSARCTRKTPPTTESDSRLGR